LTYASLKNATGGIAREKLLNEDLDNFLLCTSCTVSYVFATLKNTDTPISSSSQMIFKDGGMPVDVDFYATELSWKDKNGDKYKWAMDLGVINPNKYKANSFNYFDYFNENVLGLAPMLTNNSTLLDRQFLYNFIRADSQLDADGKIQYSESYAFNGGDAFTVGGNITDYEAMPCYDQFNASVPGFLDKSLSIPEAIAVANDSLNFSPPLYYADEDVMLKI